MKTLMRCIVGLVAAVAVAGVPNARSAPTGPPPGITPVHYVSPGGAHVYPFTSMENAANDIQSAVNAAAYGDMVIVGDGHYLLNAKIAVINDITVQSINGPETTVVDGNGTTGCFWLEGPCQISGFSIVNGAVLGGPSNTSGGGIRCNTVEPLISNCSIVSNVSYFGGGVYRGTLIDCVIRDNTSLSQGGGSMGSTLFNCSILSNAADYGGGYLRGYGGGIVSNCLFVGNVAIDGGGMYQGQASYCEFIGNMAAGDGSSTSKGDGGGIYDGTAEHCLFDSNYAFDQGGGMYNGPAEFCVFRYNSAFVGSAMYLGSANNSLFTGNVARHANGWALQHTTARNCTIVGNSKGMIGGAAFNSIIWDNGSGVTSDLNGTPCTNCCSPWIYYSLTGNVQGDNGNITNAPMFVDPDNGDFRLLATSPCIDAGNNAYVTSAQDLDGNERIADGDLEGTAVVDMGAYEFQVSEIQIRIQVSTINLSSKGRTPVAVLTTEEFDAATIDPASVRFAGAASLHYSLEDVDGDGDLDLKLHFMTADLEIDPADTEGILIGQTYGGQIVVGTDTIKIVPSCKRIDYEDLCDGDIIGIGELSLRVKRL